MSKEPRTEPTAGAPEVQVGPWTGEAKPKRRDFPGRSPPGAPLRAAFTAAAYADLAQHAKESLKAEICGVLVGSICSDGEGLWAEVVASLRGNTTSQGSAHVTFTQETWKQIHADLERLHPKLRIVGWYHSHPGFGVVFSEMDTFIHRNFFSGQGQLALVTDPLSGEDAICCNTEGGIRYLGSCLVDGRERALKAPAAPAAAESGAAPSAAGNERLSALEARISQLVASLDEMRERAWNFNLLVGMVVVFAVVLYIGWLVWDARFREHRPPEVLQDVSVPVRIGDKDVQLFARIYKWEVPDDLRSEYKMLIELALEKKQAEDKARAEAEEKARTDAGKKPAGDTPPPTPAGAP
jgi:proteasome lid subunit RPN8/RPN11